MANHNRVALDLVLSKWFPVGGEASERERVLIFALRELADRLDSYSVKSEDLTIASALSAFEPDTEAQLCAFLQSSEESRTRGMLQGWKLQTGPNGHCCALLLPGGEVVTATCSTLSEAMVNVSHQLITGTPLAKG
jgi:hypothetical protein